MGGTERMQLNTLPTSLGTPLSDPNASMRAVKESFVPFCRSSQVHGNEVARFCET